MPHGRTVSQEQKLRAELAKGFREGGLLWCECCPVRFREPTLWVHLHERKTRGRGGDPCDEFNVIRLCQSCHDFIHANPQWALEQGFMEHA